MSTRFQKLAADTKTRITEIDLATYKKQAASPTPPLLIDVRDAEEFAAGHPVGAIHISRGTLEGKIEEIAPDVFTLLDDGLAYVKEGAKVFSDPGGPEGLANVPAGMEEATIESAEECPGECIYIEIE